MAAGFSVNTANIALTAMGTASVFVGLNTGDPGTAGTALTSSVTTRPAVTWAGAAGGTIAASNTPSWTNWTGTSPETVSWISFWSLSSAGTFAMSMQLSSSVTMNTGDSLTLTTITVNIPTAS